MSLLEIFDPKAAPRPIGIDLGTTNSLVAVAQDARPRCLLDCDGHALLPSVVHYSEHGQVIVGRDAQRLAASFPCETIVSVKRFMGRDATDPKTTKLNPYRFIPPSNNNNTKIIHFNIHKKTPFLIYK